MRGCKQDFDLLWSQDLHGWPWRPWPGYSIADVPGHQAPLDRLPEGAVQPVVGHLSATGRYPFVLQGRKQALDVDGRQPRQCDPPDLWDDAEPHDLCIPPMNRRPD